MTEDNLLKVTVVDEESLSPDGRLTIIAKFATVAEAEGYIAELERSQPDKVHRGGFGIDY